MFDLLNYIRKARNVDGLEVAAVRILMKVDQGIIFTYLLALKCPATRDLKV